MIASTLETALGLGSLAGILFFIGCAILGIAAVIMPIVVIFMHLQLHAIKNTLASMEHMMRHGIK